jgi:pimeloyl-ACP methyl ester carboxylesterase
MRVNGVDLCVDTVGDRRDPAVLLIGGAGAAMDWWEDEFCHGLAAGGRLVIRYDSRDTGQSVSYPAGAPQYTVEDLAADAVGVLDALGLRGAHLVGISMGGALAQRVAVDHPDRVDSLVLIATSPAGPGGPDNPDLPPMSEDLQAYFAAPAELPDWSDRAAVVDFLVDGQRRFFAPRFFEEARVRRLAERIVDRSTDMAASLTNHWLIDGGQPVRARLADVGAPTLVIHGTVDPLFPYGHAEALARAIPHTELLPLPGVGHQMPPRAVWDTVIPAILRHTSAGWDVQGDRLAARSIADGTALAADPGRDRRLHH